MMACVALVALVLLQRSEGGALGIGGGSGSIMSGRGAATALTRATTIIAGVFFATSLLLAVLANAGGDGLTDAQRAAQEAAASAPAPAAPAGETPTGSLLEPAQEPVAPVVVESVPAEQPAPTEQPVPTEPPAQ
jgi:preprotein translocase subunit SecG